MIYDETTRSVIAGFALAGVMFASSAYGAVASQSIVAQGNAAEIEPIVYRYADRYKVRVLTPIMVQRLELIEYRLRKPLKSRLVFSFSTEPMSLEASFIVFLKDRYEVPILNRTVRTKNCAEVANAFYSPVHGDVLVSTQPAVCVSTLPIWEH